MRLRAPLLLFFVFLLSVSSLFAVSTTLVISQIQVAGGTAADEFVELHNVSGSAIDLNGYRVVYRSAAGTSDVAVINWTTSTMVPAGGYYLIVHATGYDNGASVAGDITFPGGGTGTFAAAGGGMAIRNGAANTGTIIDSIGYGTATNAFVEGTVKTPTPTSNASLIRGSNGCTDTDNNNNDFALLATAAPRNSATTPVTCGATNAAPVITAPANPAATVAQDAAPFTVNISGTDDNNIFNWTATPGTGVQSVSVTGGQGTATATYTVTLTSGYSGTATFTATLSDNVNTAVNQAVNITVVAPPVAPSGLSATSGTSHVQLNWGSVSGATSYNVKRSTTAGSGYATIASPATNSYDDTSATNGTAYFYVVSAVGAGGEGSNSSEVSATAMAAPVNVVATPGNAHVQLNWDAVAGATGYDVRRSTTAGSGYVSVATPATNSYDDTSLTNGVTYYYVVIATNASGTSSASSEVSGAPAAPGKIVISQVYGGAGCGTVGCSTYKNDYIELFNSGGTAVSVNGWSVQYGPATGTSTWSVTALTNVSIQPGQYYLVAEGAGANGVNNIPTADATGGIAMSATAGKVAVLNTTTALVGGCPASASILDLVGYGSTANCNEGGANAPAPSTTTATIRAGAGCTDGNNNASDFAAGAPTPRNTATALHLCGAPPANLPPAITAPANPAATVVQDAAPFTVNISGTDDNNIFNWSATPGTGVQSVSVTGGQGTATATYAVTLQPGFTGSATFTATLTDNVNPAANQAVNITVNVPPPPPAPTGVNATPGDSHVLLGWNSVAGASSYNVKRSTTNGSGYATIASPTTTSYDDTTAVNGTTYYYVVSAVGAGGEGVISAQVSATPASVTAVPTGLVAVVSSGSVAVSWNAVGGATSYNLKRSTTAGGPYSTINSPTGTSYTDTAVTNGTRYFYVVSAVAPGSGESANSTEVHAKPDVPEALGIDISQVYGGGGNTGSVYTNDFIELFNRGNSVVDLNGWSVQYASSTSASWTVTALTGTLAPGRHYLIQQSAGGGGTTPLPTPDASGGFTMAAGAAKVALVATTVPLSAVCPAAIDFVGYGSGPNCFEGAGTTPTPSATNSAMRLANGCTDTNNNNTDFTATTANPRNSAAAATPCTITAIGSATPSSVASGGSVLLVVELPPATAGGTVTGDLTNIGGAASQAFFDNGTNGDVTAGDNIFSFQTTATGSAGVKSVTIAATNASAQSTNTSILVTITPPLETIAAVKVDTTPADTVPDRLNQPVLVRGVVTSVDFRGGAGIEYYIQDPTGGIDVFNTTDLGPALSVGSSVEVSGTITQFNGLTEMTPSSITVLPAGTVPAVTPQVITVSQLADGSGESLEGKLVRIDNVTVTSGTFPASGASGNVTIGDGVNSGTLRVDSDTDIDGTTAPAGVFSVIGLVGQSDSTNPFDCCYQLLPRSTADIIPRTAPTGSGAANPPSVPPGGTTLLTVTVTLGQNPASTGVTVVGDLSSIGLSGAQTFYDDGVTAGDVAPGDLIYSYSATVSNGAALGGKTLPVMINDAQSRSSAASISLNVQSASAPPTPTNVVATPGDAQVSLTWDASLGASGYNVKRSLTAGGPYSTIASNIASPSYTDTSVTNAIRYYYVVSAVSGVNESGDSNEVTAKPSAPPPSGPLAKVYFVDIGQGAGTLIVSPTGKSLLIDGGPNTQGTNKIIPLLNTLGISTIDYTILTHYHIDHDGGLIELINAGRVAGTAYDNGDAARVQPPVLSNSTGQYYTTYINALAAHSGTITRQTILPGTVIDLGGGMKATCMVAGGNFLSGGNVYISNTDLNSESISTLIEYNDFDLLISGDMTGGGQTTTAKTPDVETFVGQMVGDIDFVQLDHHGSTTANGRRFLSQLKAEASLASVGATNTFGHPNRETVNKYLNIPVTSGNTYGGEGVPPNPGNGPVFYQTDPSPATDNRCSVQGYSGTDQAHAGEGTVLLKTDGLASFTMESFDDGGVRIPASTHVYALDSTGAGVTTNFPPTVIPYLSPAVPTAADVVTVTALVNDREDPISSVTLNYAINGAMQAPVTMTNTVGSEWAGTIPAQPNGTRVEYSVVANAGTGATTWSGGYFAGTTPIATLRSSTPLGEPTYLEYAARISGLVTSGTGKFSSSNNDDYIDDGTGALNIARTIEPSTPATQPTTAGTTYTVAGVINQLTGRFRLDVTPPFDGINKPWATTGGSFNPYTITSTGSAAVTPLARTIAQINADPEGHEAKLVTIANVTVTSGTIPASGGQDAFLTVSDGTGSIEMKIDGDGGIPGLATPSAPFTLVGIVSQDDFLRPFDTRYTIAPRDRTDLGAAAGGPSLITIAEAREDVDSTTGVSPDDYVPDRLGQQVKIRGVVTSVDFRGASGTEVYIQDPTGGVDIFSTSINTTLNIGDNIEVTGTVAQFNGLTEITPSGAADIVVLAPGTLPDPILEVVTLSQLANGGPGESYEGRLVRVNNVSITSPPATFAANTNYNITDGVVTVQMRIDSDTDIDGTAPPAGTFSVIGVLGQFDNAAPFDSGYQLFPRIRATDFLPAVPAASAINATSGTPQSATISTAFSTALQATVTDAGNAPIEGVGVTFTAPASGASGTFPNGTNTVSVATNASGMATAPTFTANGVAGGYIVTATTAALTANFNLTNTATASVTHFSVSAPSNVTNGSAFNVTVTALDASNATVSGYTGTVHFTSSSAGTLPSDYTFTGGDAGSHTFSVTLTTNGAQSVTATDGGITGSANVTVDPIAATHFSVSAPANVTGGVPFNVTVTALDPSEATVATYAGTVHFTSSSAGTLPSDYTFTVGDAGTHTFSVTLTSAGTQSITADDGTINGTTNVSVTCDTPTVPTVSATTNGTGTQDQACPAQPLTLTATSTGATSYQWYHDNDLLNGETASTYQATGAGTYYVTATNLCGTTAQSAGYVVQNPTPHSAFITSTGTLICAGGSVRLSSDSATGIQWYRDEVLIPGAGSQDYVATQAGSYTAILNALGCQSSVSNAIVLTSSASTAPNATITAPSTMVANTSGTASVADAGAGATYQWFGTAAQIQSGNGTNSVTFAPVIFSGTIKLTVTVTTPGGCTDTKSVDVTVTSPQPATHFALSAPANATAGTPFNVTVTALDASDNIASQYAGTVHFTSDDTGTLPSDFTFSSGNHGAHTFSVTLTNAGQHSVTATDTSTPSITGTTNITIDAAPQVATHFSVSAPATVTNGTPFNVTVTALDASNAVVTGYTGTVHFTSSSTGTLPSDYTFTGGDAGAHTFSFTLTTDGGQSITANDGSINGSAELTVNAAAQVATHFSVSAPANVTNGTPFNVTVTALDASNAVVTGYTGTVHFTSSSTGTLPADSTLTNGTGTFSVTLTTNGAQSITASDGSINGSANVTVDPAAQVATHFSVSAPANVTNGTPFNVTVTALDASNAVVTGYTGTVHFTSSSAGTLPADSTLTNGTGTFSVTLTTNGAQSITAADGSINGSANVTVDPAAQVATHFSVSAPANVTNGTPFNVTVTALDASNAVVTGYTGTVHFTSSSAGTLPADSTLTNGTGTFSVTLTTNGAQSITAADGSINGSANVTVDPAAQVATHFSVSAPANVTNGTPFNVTVTALDASNAVVTGYTGTVHFTSSSAGTLPADSTLTNGTGTFSVTLTTNGAQSITAADGSINGSANVTVDPAAQVATHFSVSAPANVTNGTPFNVTVTALDASNAVVTGYTGTVHFTSSSAGTLPADSTLTNGTGTFSVTLTTNGAQSITAADGSINGSANVTVDPAAQVATHFSVSAPANVTNGMPFNVTVTALDASNAVVTGYTGTVHFTSSSAGTLPADSTLTNGTGTFSVTLTTNGAQSITAADGSINGSANVTVDPAAQVATHFS
ncbi:MAG TPA: lamin tail domain-containing protein, partial [Thermoanaerobaculia bacterium]|nr:lamin tail domain-containing protein [Thermoanaerobaculia bacterium]